MKDKNLFGLLQGLFSIGTGVAAVGFVAVSGFGFGASLNLINLEKLADQLTLDIHGVENLEVLKMVSSPLTILSILIVLAVSLSIFRLSSTLFKKLKQNEIFIAENIVKMKRIALLVGSLSILSSLPALMMPHSMIENGYMFDLGYLIVALLLLAVAKVWDRVNKLI